MLYTVHYILDIENTSNNTNHKEKLWTVLIYLPILYRDNRICDGVRAHMADYEINEYSEYNHRTKYK